MLDSSRSADRRRRRARSVRQLVGAINARQKVRATPKDWYILKAGLEDVCSAEVHKISLLSHRSPLSKTPRKIAANTMPSRVWRIQKRTTVARCPRICDESVDVD